MKAKDFLYKVRNHVLRHKNPLFKCTPEMFESYGKLIGVSKEKIYRHYLFCIYRYGVTVSQYVMWDFYRLTRSARNQYVGDNANNRICFRVNPMLRKWKGGCNCFTDKIRFNEVFADYVHRSWISTEASEEDVLQFLQTHDKVIIKPIDGGGGHGIHILNTGNENCREKAKELKADRYLIEEVVSQCGEMSLLHPSSINTVRVVSYIDGNGEALILGAAVRVGIGNMVIDNQSSGGILFPVDAGEGIVCGYGVTLAGVVYFEQPDTHQMMLGFRIPRWKELIEFVKSAAKVVPSQKMVGWDICIGPSDFIMIEGNLLSCASTHQTNYKGNRSLLKK